jgi:hypothetical protein
MTNSVSLIARRHIGHVDTTIVSQVEEDLSRFAYCFSIVQRHDVTQRYSSTSVADIDFVGDDHQCGTGSREPRRMSVEVENGCPGSAGSEFDSERVSLRGYRLYWVIGGRKRRKRLSKTEGTKRTNVDAVSGRTESNPIGRDHRNRPRCD